ncbi:MAG: RDD family protein [Bdellovibrionota bacterium]
MSAEGEIEIDQMYSSLGRRVVALFLDGLIFAIPCAIANSLIPVIGGIIAWFFYAPILESSEIRATLGKHLMGIQVADLSGRRISLKAAVIRNLLKIVSSALLFLGFVVALFTRRKQTLHDLLADTVVVYGRSETSVPEAWVASSKEVFSMGQAVISEKFPGSSGDSVVTQLEKLQALREKGAITEEEFLTAKAKILRR